MCGPSLREVGRGIPELLIRNKNVTDGQMDRPTYQATCANYTAILDTGKGDMHVITFNTTLP